MLGRVLFLARIFQHGCLKVQRVGIGTALEHRPGTDRFSLGMLIYNP